MQKDIKMGMMAGTTIAIISFIIFSIAKPSNDNAKEQYQDRISLDKYQQAPVEKPQKQEVLPRVLTTKIPARPEAAYPSTKTSLTQPSEVVSNNQTQRNLGITAPLKKHTVTQGETLSSISLYYYGDTTHWRDILKANRNILSNPNNLRPGMHLVIPNQTR